MNLPEGYQRLVNAIILQAVKDYRRALRRIQRNPLDGAPKRRKREIERFFRSQWFKDICDLDGETIMKSLQEEVTHR